MPKPLKEALGKEGQKSSPKRTKAKRQNAAPELGVEQLSLQQIRKSRQKSQQEIADKLSVQQGEVSKIEKRSDMYVSTLKNYIQALGGELDLIASFPDSNPVFIAQFDRAVGAGIEGNELGQLKTRRPNTPSLRRKGLESLWFWSIYSSDTSAEQEARSPNSKPIQADWYQKLLHQVE